MRVKDNLQQISTQINDKSEKNNFSTKPNVIAVTKYVTIERAKEAYEAGIRHFGENRLEGFFSKERSITIRCGDSFYRIITISKS